MFVKRGTQEESVKSHVMMGPEIVVMQFEDGERGHKPRNTGSH